MTEFIADIGSNHNQDLGRALDLIDAASEIGCDGVKFQLFKVRDMYAAETLRKRPELLRLEERELPRHFLPALSRRCQDRDMLFGLTLHSLNDIESTKDLVDFYKVSSYELLWIDLIEALAKTGKGIVMSTGMADIYEVSSAYKACVSYGKFPTILHCVSSYPTKRNQANLSVIGTLRTVFKHMEIGYSDHSADPDVVIRAVKFWGAEVVEFHLDTDGEGYEFGGHCWMPEAIRSVISNLNHPEPMDGEGAKEPLACEMDERLWRHDPTDGKRPMLEAR